VKTSNSTANTLQTITNKSQKMIETVTIKST